MNTQLTTTETDRLQTLEDVIRSGLQGFMEVGEALVEIKTEKLYRESFPTFKEYCETRWSMSRPRAYLLIAAAKVVEDLSTIVDKPKTEAQARPLAALPPEERSDAWQEAVDTAPEHKTTARHVKAVVDKRRGKAPPPSPTCRVCGVPCTQEHDTMCPACYEAESETHIQTAEEEMGDIPFSDPSSTSPATSAETLLGSETSDGQEDNSFAQGAPELEKECKREIEMKIQSSLNTAHKYGQPGLHYWRSVWGRFDAIAEGLQTR